MSARTNALVSQQEAGKIAASIGLRYVRLPSRRELLIQRARGDSFLFSRCGSWKSLHDANNVERSSGITGTIIRLVRSPENYIHFFWRVIDEESSLLPRF